MRKIAANYIFPIDGKPIKNGYVAIDDDGTVLETGTVTDETESTEFYNGILMPGLVNTHCHIELSHLKGCFRQDSGMDGFIQQINSLRLNCSKEERIEAIENQMQRLYDQGVSAMADISNCDESFAAKASSAIYTRTFLEVFGTEPGDCPAIMEEVTKLQETAMSYGIDAAPTPHSCYTSSKELIGTVSEYGLESAGTISYHSEESWEEQEMICNGRGPLYDDYSERGTTLPQACGKNSLEYFIDILKDKMRVSRIGGRILLVHNTFTDSRSIAYAKGNLLEPYWAICPKSNMFIHRALPPLELMMGEGLKITLGTDSLSSNTSLEMAEEIYAINRYFPEIPLEEILKWATLNGAEFLSASDRLGSFAKGKKPGVTLIDNIDFERMKLTPSSKSKRIA